VRVALDAAEDVDVADMVDDAEEDVVAVAESSSKKYNRLRLTTLFSQRCKTPSRYLTLRYNVQL
jgi:hypothetical protein